MKKRWIANPAFSHDCSVDEILSKMSPSRARESSPSKPLPADQSVIVAPGSLNGCLDWHVFFEKDNPLEIDIGCGKGRFLLSRAAKYPQRLLLGIDQQAKRLRKIDHAVLHQKLTNVRLMQGDAALLLAEHAADNTVASFFVFFPDPWPKRRHHRRRLMNQSFLETAARTLINKGLLHFATDHSAYFEQVLPVFDADKRFERIPPFIPDETEKTDFELIFSLKGCTINRASWRRV